MKMAVDGGKFVVSLDFELLWGVRDQCTIETYGENLRGVQTVIPGLLDCFTKYNIKATFATVGLLFFENKKDLLAALDFRQPKYKDSSLSPYEREVFEVGESADTDQYHFAPHLIQKISTYPDQEIASHTFSHYYCLEEGQTIDDFREDIRAAVKVANKKGIAIKSIVFPRNQYNEAYLEVCRDFGITSVRGNEAYWLYEPRNYKNETQLRRLVRLLDSYINISGHHCYTDGFMSSGYLYNIPSSRFLRDYKKKFAFLEWLRLRRIKKSMTFAAREKLTYHLWWHPHNFGINQDKNFAFLEKILKHYQTLNKEYGFTSYTMSGVSEYLKNKHGK